MKTNLKSLLFALSLGCIGLFSTGCGYNSMVNKEEAVGQAWANVESQYQRRFDLIDNLVATVKGVADFEKGTLEAVVQARSQAFQTKVDISNASEEDLQKYAAAQNTLGGTIGRLMMLTEQYPDLKATKSFQDLQVQLEGTENRINKARDDYNGAVKSYNAYIRAFPRMIWAGWFGFKKKPYFQSDAGAEKAPKVDFSKDKDKE